jgi:hypothetical protein
MMALVGESACRPVQECPDGPWGGIEPGETPQWVDGSYGGSDSDGSPERPWSTIAEAITAAEPGAVIGVAAGRYVGNLTIQGKQLHLRGVCPTEVDIVGSPTPDQASAVLLLGAAASGSTIAGVAVTGPSGAIAMSGALDVRVERVWVHDSALAGIDIEDARGSTSAVVTDSLIEGTTGIGVLMLGSALILDRTVVRGGRESAATGRGVVAMTSTHSGLRADLTLSHSAVSGNEGLGLFVVGSDATVEGSVISNTRPATRSDGEGVTAQVHLATGERADVQILRSAIVDNHVAGVMTFGSLLRLEATAVSGTLPKADPGSGSVVISGRGLNIQHDVTGDRSMVEIVRSALMQNSNISIYAAGSDIVVADTLLGGSPSGGEASIPGITLQPGEPPNTVTTAAIRGTLIEHTLELGILMWASELTMEDSCIRDVAPNDVGEFGDGIVVLDAPSQLTLNRSTIEAGGRAAVSVFGGSAALAGSQLWCFPIDIAVQDLPAAVARLTDAGDNRCGCGDQTRECRASYAELEAPSPMGHP